MTSAFTEVLPPADDQLISTFFAVHMMVYLPNVSNFKVNTKNHIYLIKRAYFLFTITVN